MRVLRVLLALLLAVGPVQAQPVVDLLTRYAVPADETAASAPEGEAPRGSGAKLAELEAHLSLVSESLEAFAHPQDADKALLAAKPRLPAGTAPFFRDRAAALDALYRTLAVVDYTWALRFPDPPCAPADKRAALLRSDDGLFLDPFSGRTAAWMTALLGPSAKGKSLEAALDQASGSVSLSQAEYARLRARQNLITRALGSEEAVGEARATLYCKRADTRVQLASANRVSGLVLAAQSSDSNTSRRGLVIIAGKTAEGLEVRGAGIVVEAASGTRVLTDRRLGMGEVTALLDGRAEPVPLSVEREDEKSGLMLLRPEGDLGEAMTLGDAAPRKDDLVSAFAHSERLGAWTRTQGLVTSAGPHQFQTDAAADASMTGGAVLDEEGRVAGLLVLRPADGGDGEWPAAVPAPALRAWLGGGEAPGASPAALPDGGTTKILTASRTLLDSMAAGTGAISASADPIYTPTPWGTVRGVCMANCEDPGAGSSYSGNGSAELGQALGKLMALGAQALIFKGIPALFRGLGSVFKSRPAISRPEIFRRTPVAVQEEKPPEPPRINCTFSKIDEPALIGVDAVKFEVRFSCDDQASGRKVPLEGHKAAFTLGWDGEKPQYENIEVPTDSRGRASITFQIKNSRANAERSFDGLAKYDPDRKPEAETAASGAIESAASPAGVLFLRGEGTTVRSLVRLSLRGGASIAAGGTLGEIVVAGGAASMGIIVAGGAVVIFTVNYGLNEMISAQDKYNEAVDTRRAERPRNNRKKDKFTELDAEAAEDRDDEPKDCPEASDWQLNRAGILGQEHQFKTDHGAVPNSFFDICACKDGSIIIKGHGKCGKPGPSIPTAARWRNL